MKFFSVGETYKQDGCEYVITKIDWNNNEVHVAELEQGRPKDGYIERPQDVEMYLMDDEEREFYSGVGFWSELSQNERLAIVKVWHCVFGSTTSALYQYAKDEITINVINGKKYAWYSDCYLEDFAVNVATLKEATPEEYKEIKAFCEG